MGQLPTGTVTMLFSDIEGSTVLLNRLGSRWADALTAQRSILRACFEAHEGHEMGTEGDSFFVVFASAHAALAAALEGQRQLQAYSWPNGVPLRVRMGLHTGEPQRHEDGYIGLDVHRAARIAATASGGQIVLSEAAKVMLSDVQDDAMRDLGWHRLKDLEEPEHLYDAIDVRADGLADFVPLKSLGTRARLPLPGTPLIGRADELAELVALFERDEARLVTLTGPGGSGKTHLALATASALEHMFPQGVFFVGLHTADREALMWAGIAETVGAQGDVVDAPRERVLRLLRDRAVLLVLDNLEQVHQADVVIDQLLVYAPAVRVLATSRRTMHLVSENERPVPPLGLPEAGQRSLTGAEESSAVQLFVRRATMAHPRFRLTDENVADVVELCRRLDGLPLAIELAAARSRLLTPHAMLTRIDERLGIGVTGADRVPRQRSLGDTIAWSYNLLDEAEQQFFRRLGVFSGGCDLQAVEAVAGSDSTDSFDIVARLVDASLVTIVDSPDGEPRVSMLQTIRAFARDRLDASGEADDVHLRHARWCSGVATETSRLLGGSMQTSALDRLEGVEEDIRAALDWCLRPGEEAADRIEYGLQMLSDMTPYWYRFGYLAEGRGWLERGVAAAGGVESTGAIDALHGMAVMMLQQDEVAPAIRTFQQALDMARRLGDRARESRESNSLGIAHRDSGDLTEARRLIEQSLVLARDADSDLHAANALANMVMVLVDSGEYGAAVAAAEESIAADLARDDRWGVAITNANLTMALLRTEGPDRASRHLIGFAADALALADKELAITTVELFACVLSELGAAAQAGRLMGAVDSQRDRLGMPRPAFDTERLERSLLLAMELLSPDEWEGAYAAGQELSMDEAAAEALAAFASRDLIVPSTHSDAARHSRST